MASCRTVTLILAAGLVLALACGSPQTGEEQDAAPASSASGFRPIEPLTFPPPQAGFTRGSELARGEWRVWIDGRVVNPEMHVGVIEGRLYRAVANDVEPSEPLTAWQAGGWPSPVLGADGAILARIDGQLVWFPVTGPRRTFEQMDRIQPLALYEDGFVAIDRGSPMRLVLISLDGDPRRTLTVIDDDADVSPPAREGSRLVWTIDRARVFAIDLSTDTPARELVWTPRGERWLTLDGLAGPWVVAHAGTTVHLLGWQGTRELRLPCPGDVVAVHADGVWCNASGRLGHLLWWDPLSGRRIPSRSLPHIDPWQGGRVIWEDDRTLVGLWALPATPDESNRIDGEVLRAAIDRVSWLRDTWKTKSPARWDSPEAGWPAPEGTVTLLAEILSDSTDLNAARSAAHVLGWCGLPGSRQALLDGADLPNIWTRQLALSALAWCGLPGDSQAILNADIPPGLVADVAPALAIIGDAEAVAWLEARRDLSFRMPSQTEETRQAVDDALSLLRDRPHIHAAWEMIRE